MKREYYSATIHEFLQSKPDMILGELLINDEFETTDLQKNAWRQEIAILQDQFVAFHDGEIAFEYTVPRIGHRIDVVVIVRGIIFLLEFKVGDDEYRKSTDDQVMDYALDLKYFHDVSKNRLIIPINVSTEGPDTANTALIMEDGICCVLHCNKHSIARCIQQIICDNNYEPALSMSEWLNARYAPTPTIIEAAQALYRNHSVKDISRNDAGAENLTLTTDAINQIIDKCKSELRKAICFVTGVPGAGKTLAGLNIANERHQFESEEHAVFLSGNGPLVDVLQVALAKDRAKREKITIESAKRETKAFIQIIHKFRDEALTSNRPPIEKVAIFDEAQRAWDKDALTDFMKRKKGVANFNQSEPEFLISIMDRHEDWSTIVCLVGGGQEIFTGEAGIGDWFRALQNRYFDWDIYLSDKMAGSEYVGTSTIDELLCGRKYIVEPSLHLGVSLRSFRSEKLSDFTKALLDNNVIEARQLYEEFHDSYPIYITRDFEKAKQWVKSKSRGSERYGLLASSEAKRLRGVGIWVPSEINHVGWFLNDKDNVDSSYYLEVAASEFKVQGLEIDYGLLAWDADFRYVDDHFEYYRFRGASWNHVNIEQRKRYLKNAYRVLLTRARQGLIIYLPRGDDSDPTRNSKYYNGTYHYLKRIGIKEV